MRALNFWKNKNKSKDFSIGFNVYADVEKIYPLLFKQIEKVNNTLPDEMDKKIEQLKKKLPGRFARNLNSAYMFMETLKRSDHVRIQVLDSDNVKVPFAMKSMYWSMMREARKITREFLVSEGIEGVRIK